MVRSRHFIALLLLALWLPATQRCALEAAGFFDWCGFHHDSNEPDCPPGTDCGRDGCQILEQHLVQPALDAAMPAPVLFFVWLIQRIPVERQAPPEVAICIRPHFRQVHIVRCWPFERRAAPIPRAPSAAS